MEATVNSHKRARADTSTSSERSSGGASTSLPYCRPPAGQANYDRRRSTLIAMTDDISATTEANRVSWNQIASRRHGNPADFYRDNGVSLEDFELELAGDVTGKRVLQLACSHGDQVLSWANLGATAIGIDISDVAIDNARRKAAEAQIAAEFRQADMFDLPADLINLDLIYLSWGVICWAPH